MKQESKVSIIVAAYNSENYIERCIKSIQNQSYKNIEIVIVDDGSTDNTGAICDTIASDDNRIIVIHQKNSGVGSARNRGLSLVNGDFVAFVDSDDIVSSEYVMKLVSVCIQENVKLAICQYEFVDYPKEYVPNNESGYKIYNVDYRILKHKIIGRSCGILYARGLVNSLKYDLDLYVGEDLLFLCQALNNVNSIALLKDALYCYYIYNTSSSHGQYDSKKYTEIISWNRVMKLFENKDRVFINALHRLYGWVLFSNLASMYRYGYEDEMKMNYCIEQLRKSLWSVINPMPGGDRKRLLLYLNYIVMSISPRTGYKMLDGMLSLKHKILKY